MTKDKPETMQTTVCPKTKFEHLHLELALYTALYHHFRSLRLELPHGTRYPADENQLSSLSSALLIILFRSLVFRKITGQFKSKQTHRYYCIFPKSMNLAKN